MTDQPNSGSANPDPGASSPTPPPSPPPLAPLVDAGASTPPPAGTAGPLGEAPPTGWAPAEGQPPAPVPPPPVAKPPSKIRTYITFGVIAVVVALIAFAISNNAAADDLAIGQCFDVPDRTENISTVEKHECTEEHDAEVFFVGEMTGTTYPLDSAFDDYVDQNCIPAFATYVGRTYEEAEELDVGYFYPNADGWADDDRTLTCYIVRVDEAKMTQSVKAAS